MPKINKLILKNVKGTTSEVELSGRDIWTGPNGAGKSTHLEGFMAAKLGYIPGRGKLLADVYRMASDEEMEVGLEADNGFRCSRTIREKCTKKRTGERSYSLTSSVSVFPPRDKNEDGGARIAKELGDISALLDLGDLFAKSDTERRKFIFSLTDPASFGWDRERVFEEVIKSNDKFEGLLKDLRLVWNEEASIQDNVALALEWAKGELSAKKAELKKAQAAKEQLLAQKRELGSDPGSAAELSAELAQARQDLSKLTADVASAQAKVRSAVNLKSRIDRLNGQMAAPESKTYGPELTDPLKSLIKECESEIDRLSKGRDAVESEAKTISDELESCKPMVRKADTRVGSLSGMIAKVEGAKGVCPLLGEKCQSDLSKFVDTAKRDLAAAEKTAAEASDRVDSFESKLKVKRDEYRQFTKTIEQKSSQMSAAQKTLDSMIKANEMAAKDAENRESLRSEVERAQKELSGMGLVDVAPLEAARDGMAGRVADLDREVVKRQAIANLLDSFDRANLEAERLAEEVDLLDDLARCIGPDNLQGKILKDTVGPLIDKVNSLLERTGRGYNLQAVMEGRNGQQVFGFTWNRNGKEIPYKSLSGGETVVFGAALCTAMLLMKNPPCKSLVVEASECDEGNLRALMEAIGQFGKELDNVLIATHHFPIAPSEVPDWSIHNLSLKDRSEATVASTHKTEERFTF